MMCVLPIVVEEVRRYILAYNAMGIDEKVTHSYVWGMMTGDFGTVPMECVAERGHSGIAALVSS